VARNSRSSALRSHFASSAALRRFPARIRAGVHRGRPTHARRRRAGSRHDETRKNGKSLRLGSFLPISSAQSETSAILIRVSRPLSWAEFAVAVVVVAAPSQVAKSGAAPLHAVRGVVLSPSTRQPTPATSQSLPRRRQSLPVAGNERLQLVGVPVPSCTQVCCPYFRQTADGQSVPGQSRSDRLVRDDFSSNRHPALAFCLSMSFSQSRFPLLRDML
jgi:hypothetical protein